MWQAANLTPLISGESGRDATPGAKFSHHHFQMRYSSYYLADKRNDALRTKLAELEAESS